MMVTIDDDAAAAAAADDDDNDDDGSPYLQLGGAPVFSQVPWPHIPADIREAHSWQPLGGSAATGTAPHTLTHSASTPTNAPTTSNRLGTIVVVRAVGGVGRWPPIKIVTWMDCLFALLVSLFVCFPSLTFFLKYYYYYYPVLIFL